MSIPLPKDCPALLSLSFLLNVKFGPPKPCRTGLEAGLEVVLSAGWRWGAASGAGSGAASNAAAATAGSEDEG